jgi:hypothetical protein
MIELIPKRYYYVINTIRKQKNRWVIKIKNK